MNTYENLIGKQFGKRTVISRAPNRKMPNGREVIYWNVECACGETTEVSTANLKRKTLSSSSACLSCMNVIHAYSRPKTPTYTSWTSMRTRCLNKKAKEFVNYGGRGIGICSEWDDFLVFLADMGERPENTSLERIDNNKSYSSSNCKWGTPAEQQRNTRLTRLTKDLVIEIRNSPLSAKELAVKLNIGYSTVRGVRNYHSWKDI